MATFGISTPREMLGKLLEEQKDLHADGLSARHAINATMTAHHLYEWVWGAFLDGNPAARSALGLSPALSAEAAKAAFRDYCERECPAMADARKVANGSKHFKVNKVRTGEDEGPFDPAIFDPAIFDVGHLWIERNGQKQPVEEFVQELVDFWSEFLAALR
jgi:hypothetical protein